MPPLPYGWDTPHTAWPAVRVSGRTRPGGHGHTREPRGGGVFLRRWGHRPEGVGHVGVRHPLAGGVGGHGPGLSPVASPASGEGTRPLGAARWVVGPTRGPVRGPERAYPRPWAVLTTRWGHPTRVRSAGLPQAWGGPAPSGAASRVPAGGGEVLGPRWGRVSASVVPGPGRRSGGRVGCGGCVGKGGTPESEGTGRVPEQGVVPIPPRTSGCKRRPEASAALPLPAAPEPQRYRAKKAWRLLQGESPCRVRARPPPVASLASMAEPWRHGEQDGRSVDSVAWRPPG
jgi:hypothetical protein